MKIKARTKKIAVLSVMVVLLVATGVLNFVLNDRLNSNDQTTGIGDGTNVISTFFASARSDRNAMRESEFLCLDAILNSEQSSETAKKEAETKKMELVERMEMENNLETLVKAKGYEDAIVTINDNGVNVVVVCADMTGDMANAIKTVVVSNSEYVPSDVKVIPYN